MRQKLFLSMILVLVLVTMSVVYVAMEPARQAAAAKRQQDEAIASGTQLYATLCVTCHGPQGEGVVGMPLNRPVFRDGNADELASSGDLIRQTVTSGRSGTATPSAIRLPDGSILSRTAMPAWSQEKGGSLTAQQINDVVAFIQYGDWSKVQGLVVPPKMQGDAPTNSDLPQEDQDAGLNLFKTKGCIACHALGSMGGHVGPELTHVGSWRDADYLSAWISGPDKMDRSNFIWSSGLNVGMGKAVMPTIPMPVTDLKTLVNYLSSLK